MIPFFRKLRKQLADDNKPLKYLRYAIGEIILVVVGILIALSINNWNEYRKERLLEYGLLGKISENILEDIAEYEIYAADDSVEITNIDSVLAIIRNPFKYQTNDINKPIKSLLVLRKLTPNKSAVTNLISSGKINIIENKDLLEQILEYYNRMDRHIDGVDDALFTYTRNQIGPYLMQFDFIDSTTVISPYRKRRPLIEYHQDPAIENLLSLKIKMLEFQKNTYQGQIDYAKNLLEQISEELERQDNH